MNRTPSRRAAGALVITALLTLAAACGGSSSGGGGDTVATASADSALAAKVPADIKSAGVLTIGTDGAYAPNEFLAEDGKTVTGWDVDLLDAVAAKLGLKTKYVVAPFGTIIQGVGSGKFDMGMSSFTINSEREQQATMVSYYNAGTQWATQKGNPSGISPDNACGKKVAVQKDTVQVDDLNARSKKCTDAGKGKITIDQYVSQDDATAAAISGKDDAMLADSPICAYAVKQTNGQLELLGDIYEAAPYGYVVPKDGQALADVLKGALQAVLDDGTYQQVLEKWGVEGGAITNPEINPKV